MHAATDLLNKIKKSGGVRFQVGKTGTRVFDAFEQGGGEILHLRYEKLRASNDELALKEWRIAVFGGLEGVMRSGAVTLSKASQDETVPVPVTIVSMPARQTTTDIKYDDQGNIANTRQVETDLG